MKNLRIFYSKKNPNLKQFALEAKKMGLKAKLYQYENFSFANDSITYAVSKKFEKFNANDVLLFRFCPYDKKQYHFWLRSLAILAKEAGARIINEDFVLSFPFQSDKLFQAIYFSNQQIPHIETYRLSRKLKSNSYPFLIKKRNGSMGLDSHIVKNEMELTSIKKKLKNLDSYIIQPFLELERDIRVIVLNGKVIGAAERQVELRTDRLAVKTSQLTVLTAAEQLIIDQTLSVFKLDLAGLDIFTSKTGRTWLGEINFFPGFGGFMKVSQENIFEKILLMMANSK